MTYYAIRRSIKDGNTTSNERTGDKAAMERQFHLYCASAATNEAGNEVDSIEWGTIEQGALERKRWTNEEPEAEAEG